MLEQQSITIPLRNIYGLQHCNGRLVTVFLMFVFTRDIVWSFGLYISYLYVDLAIVCLCTCIVCLAGLPGRPAFC